MDEGESLIILYSAVADADAEGEGMGFDIGETGGFHHVLHGLAGDEGVDGLGEVFVGAGFVAGDEGGGAGEDFGEVEVVERAEEAVGGEGELEDDEAAAGFEDALEFFDGGEGVLDVADAEGDGEDIGVGIGQGKSESVGVDEFGEPIQCVRPHQDVDKARELLFVPCCPEVIFPRLDAGDR